MSRRPVVAVADLHGHVDHLDALLAYLDRSVGDYDLVTLGDYCDNGPAIPALLDRLIALKESRGDRFVPILGNHDYACLRALADDEWFDYWHHYWNGFDAGTPAAYGAHSSAELRTRMPVTHRDFLASLPWVHVTELYAFVHAGLLEGPLGPQIHELEARTLPEGRFDVPPALRGTTRARVADERWDRVVVSGHDKRVPRPAFVGPNRICLCSEVDETRILRAVVLPERRFVAIDERLIVAKSAGHDEADR